MPRSAATDFARRNKKSGISRVVFMIPYYHIYGTVARWAHRCVIGGNLYAFSQTTATPCPIPRKSESLVTSVALYSIARAAAKLST